MGQSSITLFDGKVFDIEERFPAEYKTVGLSMSSGVESAILLPLLVDRYGKENVHAYTAWIPGRRNWESQRAIIMADELGVRIRAADSNFQFMGPEENKRLREIAYSDTSLDAWFAGGNRLRFAPTFFAQKPNAIEDMRKRHIHLPFFDLLKSHTVDLHYKFHTEHLLYQSHSCTERGDIHCGKCYCCWERVRGFADIGKIDQSTYGVPWKDMLDECFHTDKHFNKNW
jgi:hypothetical protein